MRDSIQVGSFREPGPISWRWILLLTTVAGALRFIHLNSDLWLDEVGTLVSYLRLPIGQIVRTYGSMNQHLLYSVLARVSVVWFGESAWAVRLPAAILGTATIPALYYTARAMTSEREALLVSALLAVSYHHIWFSQDARGYSAMVFFALLGTGFLIRALSRPSAFYWVGYAAAMTLGVISLQNTVFVVLGQWICCTWLLRGRRNWSIQISVLSIAALSLLAHALMLREMVQFMLHAERTGLGWTSISELFPIIRQGLLVGFGLAGLGALGALSIAGWYSYWRQTHLLAGILIAPVALNILLLMILRIGAYPRSFLYELPFALLIAVRGSTILFRRHATTVCLLLTAIALVPLVRYYRFPKQDYSGALAYVQSHQRPGDKVMAADLAGTCYRRYYFPDMEIVTAPAQIRALKAQGSRVWVLYSFPREFQLRSPELFRYIRSELQPAASFPGTLGGGDLYVARTK